MTFKIVKPYNPGENGYSDPLTEAIFAGLYYNKDTDYTITIQPGFYNPLQMMTELTNKFNEVVSKVLLAFFTNTPDYNYALPLFETSGYTRFTIIYDDVGQKIWFGNNADQFILTNDSQAYLQQELLGSCTRRNLLPNFSAWGLPAYLGFTKCPILATQSPTGQVPRFYYTGLDNGGFWLLPTLPGASVYFIEPPLKINFMGPAYFYMEIDGLNCIDETSPWYPNNFTMRTNESYGVVNSAFAKIPIPTTPVSQWFDQAMPPYKYFNPPAERIRKLKIKLRYHDGELIDFGNFDYSFMLEFIILRPSNDRSYTIRDSSSLAKIS
jgi:hypothetical protein